MDAIIILVFWGLIIALASFAYVKIAKMWNKEGGNGKN